MKNTEIKMVIGSAEVITMTKVNKSKMNCLQSVVVKGRAQVINDVEFADKVDAAAAKVTGWVKKYLLLTHEGMTEMAKWSKEGRLTYTEANTLLTFGDKVQALLTIDVTEEAPVYAASYQNIQSGNIYKTFAAAWHDREELSDLPTQVLDPSEPKKEDDDIILN